MILPDKFRCTLGDYPQFGIVEVVNRFGSWGLAWKPNGGTRVSKHFFDNNPFKMIDINFEKYKQNLLKE